MKPKIPLEAIKMVVVPFEKSRLLSIKQRQIIKGLSAGMSEKELAEDLEIPLPALRASLMTPNIQNALGIALEKAGLSDAVLAEKLRKTMRGAGEKATNHDAIKAIELAARLKGHLNKEPETVNNTYINELKFLSVGEL